MITIVLTYRNRDLRIIKKCLDSLAVQSLKDFKVVLVDYGSEASFVDSLCEIVEEINFIKLISCPVKGQLWNKSRAINIALKQTTTPYFLVGDIDLIFHPDFIKTASKLAFEDRVTYFQYGFLSKDESLLNKDFLNYNIDFLGNEEVTGTTIFPTHQLKAVNGYDEFYHGWGAEDADIHIRIRQLGLQVNYYNSEVLVKHQWHPKTYRSKKSTNPFNAKLERINHSYMKLTKETKRIKTNLNTNWGEKPSLELYKRLLNNPDYVIGVQPIDLDISALCSQLKNFNNSLVLINISGATIKNKFKQFAKKNFGKKYNQYLKLESINNRLLEEIITNYRNLPYSYVFNRLKGEINLLILF